MAWYDLFEDWNLVEASFASQYGIRLRNEHEMSWGEFSSLLSGITPETPLGQIVSIRSEEDKDVLKHFTEDQHRIRNEWRSRWVKSITDMDATEQVRIFQEAMKQAFG